MAVPVLPGAEPYSHDGGDIGVLVVHGYTGTPQSMRPLGRTLRRGRLHGAAAPAARARDAVAGTEPDAVAGLVRRGRASLRASCGPAVHRSSSPGCRWAALLATKLALDHGPRVAGLIVINPIYLHDNRLLPLLPMLRYVVPSFPGIVNDVKMVGGEPELGYDRNPLQAMHSQTLLWADVKRDLAEIIQPVLLMHSRVDNTVPVASSAYFLEHISSTDVTEIWLENSYHVATLDNDAPLIHDESVRFIERVSGSARADASEG